jgi:undecaprenyl-diphosphatase
LVFAGIALGVSEGQFGTFDRAVILGLHNVVGALGPAWIDETARNITSLGSVIVVCLIAGAYVGYLLLRGDRTSAILLLVSVLGGLVLNEVLKLIFDRPRPDLALPSIRVFSSSFPSGHAALSGVAYLTMGALATRNAPTAAVRAYVMGAAILLVFLVGTSRVYLGVHYPTDVLAGWCVGSAWAVACWQGAKEIERRQFENGRQHL